MSYMSRYLGFDATTNENYYFLSYSSDDAERIAPLAKRIYDSGVSLWYDYGLSYGERWEEIICEKINGSKAVILFFTESVISKENSYVLKEYRIARNLGIDVYFVVIDKLESDLSARYPKRASFIDDISQTQFATDVQQIIDNINKQKKKQVDLNNATPDNRISFDGIVVVDSEYLLRHGFTPIEISKRHVELDLLTIDGRLFPEALEAEGDAETWENMVVDAADCTANLIANNTIVGYMDFIPVSPENYIKLQTEPFTNNYVEYYSLGGRFDIFVSMFSIERNYSTPNNCLLFIKWMLGRILDWKEKNINIGKIEFSIYSEHQAKALKTLGFDLILENQLKGFLYEIKVEKLLNNQIVTNMLNDIRLPIYKYSEYDLSDTAIVNQCLSIASSLSVANGGILQYTNAPLESDSIIAAEYSNKVVGYVCLKKYDVLDEGIYVEQIGISTFHQRLGIGKQLLIKTIAYAKKNGFKCIYANCKKINAASLGLFTSMGFIQFDMSKEQYEGIGIDSKDVEKNIALMRKI